MQLHNIDVTLAKLRTVTVNGRVMSEVPPIGEHSGRKSVRISP